MDYDNFRPNNNNRSFYNQRAPSQQNLPLQTGTSISVTQHPIPSSFTPRSSTPPKTTAKYQASKPIVDQENKSFHRPITSSENGTQPDYSPHKMLGTYEKDYEDISRFSLDELNRELDNNINEIILLLNRRRSLILNKKRKLQEEFYNKLNDLKRYSIEDYQSDLVKVAPDDQLIAQLLNSSKNLSRMSKVMSTVVKDFNGSVQERKNFEMTKSSEFWSNNKHLENEIDSLLKRLKHYDQELEKDNVEIYELCRSLDQVDDTIRDLLLQKTEDHVTRAEPLFHSKQKQQSILNQKLLQRNKLKDEKIALIYKIIDDLNQLRGIREERLRKLGVVFGDDDLGQGNMPLPNQNVSPDASSKIQVYMEFVDQLENVSKMRDIIAQLENQEQGVVNELDRIYKENDAIFNDLVKKQSEEAKIFNDWTDNLRRRLRYIRGTEYFLTVTNLPDFQQYDFREVMKKFRDNIVFLKPLVEEDSAIRQGLTKTNETINTFKGIIRSIENEKERRRELLNILENCARLRAEEDLKTDQLRNVELEITKKNQQKKNLEEDLDGVLGDADLNTFKKIENILNNYDAELQHLQQQKRKIIKELEEINQDLKKVISQLAVIKNEYDDILKEILPSNWMNTYDLKKTTDLKHMKNYLKKTFKRFGIIPE